MYATVLETNLGKIRGLDRGDYNEFLGVRFARANRFSYAKLCDTFEDFEELDKDGVYDATTFGASCPQSRQFYEHLEIPERKFYHDEFRDGIDYTYDEDCLNLNIYAPKNKENCPVILFFYGGGFNSGSTKDASFDGAGYAKRGVILVTANYRVGVLGYLTHEEIRERSQRDGNFGLDDQYTAAVWVRKHIAEFGGDPENITLMGQSAGAISIQYLCLSEKCRGLFQRAIMLSGGGLFPKFALPRTAEKTHGYWLDFMKYAKVETFDELRKLPLKDLFAAVEEIRKHRKDNIYNTMPVIDGILLDAPIDELIKTPLPLDYLIGYTNNDMYAYLMAKIGNKFAKDNKGFVYYFDIDAPGRDRRKNRAFHSSDLRYVFGTLHNNSRRPYDEKDDAASAAMISYLSNFAQTGDPNGANLPVWGRADKTVLCVTRNGFHEGRPNQLKLLWNMLTKGDPK